MLHIVSIFFSELPEREEGEGEETPIFSHWGPPQMYVDKYFSISFALIII